MTTTSTPSGAASAASTYSELSQWLYLHTALGKGYVAPIPYTPTWIISSAVPVELVHRMRYSENEFHDLHEQSIVQDRVKLDNLEQTAQASKRTGTNPSVLAEIKDLKAKLARPVYVNYRDWSADKATMLELLSKAKFRSMSFVDEMGIRAHNYTINKFLAARHISNDLSLLSLSGDQSSDSVLIRSSATGGANMLSVRGADTPRFNLMTLTSLKAVQKISTRLKEVAPCQGITLAIPSAPMPAVPVSSDQITRIIRKVYATEDPENRVTVEFSPAWDKFLAMSPSDVSGTEAASKSLGKSLCNVQTLVRAIARAVVTRAFFVQEANIAEPSESHARVLTVDDEDLATAKLWFEAIHREVLGLHHLDVRSSNLSKGRDVWADGPSVESVIAAKAILTKLIKDDEHGMVAYSQALRTPGISPRALLSVVQEHTDTFKILQDVQKPGSKRKADEYITLVGDDKPVGGEDTTLPGGNLNDGILDALYTKWQKQAYESMIGGGKPIVSMSTLTGELKLAAIAVQKRHWQTVTCVPSGDNSHGPGLMELWFRRGPDGRDMCAWEESYRSLKLYEKWIEKDAAAEEIRSGGPDGYFMSSPAFDVPQP